MQMFNGFTMKMWVFTPYSVKYDNGGPEVKSEDVDNANQSEQLKKIQAEIAELTDNIAGSENKDKSNDKMEIQWTLNTEFRNYLEKNPQVANDLYKAVKELTFDNITDGTIKTANEQAKENLIKFLEPIVNPVTVDGEVIENAWDENWDEEINENYSYKWRYEIEDFDVEKNKLSLTINWMIENLEWGDNNLETTLKNIKMVVENPDTNKVKSLQKFLYNNLSWEAKDNFLKYNFKRWKDGKKSPDIPDWMFGTNLLEWINTYLKGLNGYISSVNESRKVQKENDDFVKQQNEQQQKLQNEQQQKLQREQQQKSAEQAEIQRVNSLTLKKIVNNEEFSKEWENIKKLSDYSDVQKQIGKVLKIEESRDLLERNKQLNVEIWNITEQLSLSIQDLQRQENDYELLRKSWNTRKNLETLRSRINGLKDKIEKQKDELRLKVRIKNDNESTLSREWSKNEQIQKWLAKLESKLKEKYMDLFVEKQKTLVSIPDWISESTRQNMAEQNKRKSDDFDRQLNAILKFWSWKINEDDRSIIDDDNLDNRSDYRKYADRVESLVKIENNQIGTIETVQ